jgi:hypothetical protein
VGNTLSRVLSSVSWTASNGMPTTKLLVVHTIIYGVLAYVALCLLTQNS